jgi:hypothetical protein
LRQERAQRFGCLALHVFIVRKRGSRRPDGIDSTVRDRLAPVLGCVEREDGQSRTRTTLDPCIGRVCLEGAHHSLNSTGSAQVQPG